MGNGIAKPAECGEQENLVNERSNDFILYNDKYNRRVNDCYWQHCFMY